MSDRTVAMDKTVWADCQGLLAEACSALEPGELIHGENFSLFEAMAAIEIMDPKMDAGMSTEGFKSAQEAIEGGSAPLDLTVPQLLDVMDQLLAYEATWQSGHTLAQTVYSCLYLHIPERTASNPLLHAYCKVVRSTCNLVRTLVMVADIHEENEDFIGATFGFPLELEEDGRCMTLLAAVEETLAKQLKAARAGAAGASPEAPAPLQADPLLEEPFCAALLARLRFRRALHQALTHLDKGPTHEKGTLGAQQAIATAAKELAIIRISSPQLARALERVTSAGTAGGGVPQEAPRAVTSEGASDTGTSAAGSGTSAEASGKGSFAGSKEGATPARSSRGAEGAGKSRERKATGKERTPKGPRKSVEGAPVSSETGAGVSGRGTKQPEAASADKYVPSGSVRSQESTRRGDRTTGGMADTREESGSLEGRRGAETPAQPSDAFSDEAPGGREWGNGADALAASLQASVLSESEHDRESGPSSSGRVSSGATYAAPSDTPHSRDRMPCTIHLREGGSTSAPLPSPSEAAGIIAGQPPIHTRDLREGVTGTAEASTASGRAAIGFDESVNRRLLGSTPPRSMKMLTWAETMDYYDRLLQDLAQITHAPSARSLADVIQFVADFSDRQPRILARSRLFLHLFPEAFLVLGRDSLTEMVLDAVNLPQGAIRKDPGVLAFAVKAARAVKALLKLLCVNNSRQRRKLARCLAEWEGVRREAEAQSQHNEAIRAWVAQTLEAQGALGPDHPPDAWLDNVFTCWTEQQICRIMTRHLSLGFPQQLYSPGELPVIFWYLSRVYVNHAGLLHTHGNHLLAMHKVQNLGGGRRKSRGGEGTGRYVPGVDQYLVTAYGRLAWGMTQAFALLQRSNKLPQHASPFNSGFEVYLQRFAPFIAVQQPVAIPYEEYTGELEYMLSAQYDVLGGALRAFEDALEMTRALSTELARMDLPRVSQARRAEECRQLEQVVQRNVVALKVLAHVGAASTHAVTCDFSYHQFFPVLVVKKVTGKTSKS